VSDETTGPEEEPLEGLEPLFDPAVRVVYDPDANLATAPPFTEPGMDDEHGGVTRVCSEEGPRTPATKKSSPDEGPLSLAARQLLASVPVDGSSMGGASLRSAVDLDDDRYAVALRELQRSGQIIVGPGRGGSIRRSRSLEASSAPTPAQEKRAEAGLYEPFLQWLGSTWPPTLDEDEDTLREATITATPKGYRQKTGRWRRLDVSHRATGLPLRNAAASATDSTGAVKLRGEASGRRRRESCQRARASGETRA
jgi:hypothetical protein